MKAKIKVGTSIKFKVRDFELVEEQQGLELEVEVKDEKELEKAYEKWQDYIHTKVIKSGFKAANQYLKERDNIIGD